MIRVLRISKVYILGILMGLALIVSQQEVFCQPKSSGIPRPIKDARLDSRAYRPLNSPSSFDPQHSRQSTVGAQLLTSAPGHVGGPPPPPPPPVPIDGAVWILIVAGAGFGIYQLRGALLSKAIHLLE